MVSMFRNRKKYKKGYSSRGFGRRFKSKWTRTKAVRRRAIGSRRRARNPFSSKATRAIKQIALGNDSPLACMGMVNIFDINPYMQYGNNPYTPSSGSLFNNPSYGTFKPTFVRGVLDEMAYVNTNPTNFPPLGTTDLIGDGVSGDTIYIKGYRMKFCGSNNDNNTYSTMQNSYRVLLVQVNQNDSQVTSDMTQRDWASLWRCDQLGTNTTATNGKQLANTMMAYRNRDELNNFKIVRDTKFRVMPYQQVPTGQSTEGNTDFSYNPVVHDFWIPVNRRYILADNGDIVGFQPMNWAILGTWQSEDATPDFMMRVDLYYKN